MDVPEFQPDCLPDQQGDCHDQQANHASTAGDQRVVGAAFESRATVESSRSVHRVVAGASSILASPDPGAAAGTTRERGHR
jgi:hypothetical protein